jgi:hypothetical protein
MYSFALFLSKLISEPVREIVSQPKIAVMNTVVLFISVAHLASTKSIIQQPSRSMKINNYELGNVVVSSLMGRCSPTPIPIYLSSAQSEDVLVWLFG